MHVVFRVDASAQIGSGHVMRCATLAWRLKQQGVQVTFICRELQGHYCSWLEEQNYSVLHLGAPMNVQSTSNSTKVYSDWLGVPMGQEVLETSSALEQLGHIDWLVVDHYALDVAWESAMRTFCKRIMVIDDLADRMHDADILLDQNLQQKIGRYDELLPASCIRLLGPEFSLLRQEFSQIRSMIAHRDGVVRRILVFLGGADPRNVTGMVLNVLSKMAIQNIAIDVVLTIGCPHLDKINALCEGMPNCELHIQTNNMAGLMANADLMIGGSGGATWERCCLGLPSVLISIAENQRAIGQEAARSRVAIYLGDDKSLSKEKLQSFLERLLCHSKLLRGIAKRALALVDGKGSSRVCAVLTLFSSTTLQARQATLEDEHLLFAWVNDPIARINAFISDPITAETHRDWFLDRLKNIKACHMYIVESNTRIPVGQVRFELVNNMWRIDFSIASIFRGRGLGGYALKVALDRLAVEEPGVNVYAQVKIENLASQKVFEQLGFEIKSKSESIIEYQKLQINLS
jgi:UDP-2,4-diacetamido-2,4,6-trideoxy-beta-L-altropyranose hydrolase